MNERYSHFMSVKGRLEASVALKMRIVCERHAPSVVYNQMVSTARHQFLNVILNCFKRNLEWLFA